MNPNQPHTAATAAPSAAPNHTNPSIIQGANLMSSHSISRSARTAALVAAFAILTIARPAAADAPEQGFKALGDLSSSRFTAFAQPAALHGASPDNNNVHPSVAWTANARGYAQSSFRRGESILFMFRASSNRTRSARVTMRVRRDIFCLPAIGIPCNDHSQTIFDGWVTFPAGSVTKYKPMVATSSDPIGDWQYSVTIDENGRSGDYDDETRYSSFQLR